ncbi:MAG TPA: toprim domain-containing protein, partial [Bacteroidia bacterium]
NVLYGMSFARKAISNEENCFLVEGYMDVISMHLAGIENVVASSGTSLTVEQIRLIKRYTSSITIMYDGDPAGIKASFRGIDMILEEGLDVRVVLFPEGHDPDSYSRKHSETEVRKFIEDNKTDFIRFKTQLLYSDTQNDPIKKASLIQEIVNSIALMPNSINRTVFIQECSKIMKMDEQALLTELNKVLRRRYAKNANEPLLEEIVNLDPPQVPQPVDTDLNSFEHHEREIIRLLLTYGNKEIEIRSEVKDENDNVQVEVHATTVAELIADHLVVDGITFENATYQKIFDEYSANKKLQLEHFLHNEDADMAKIAIDLTTSPYALSDWKKRDIIPVLEQDDMKKTIESVIYSFKKRRISKMQMEIQSRIKAAEENGNEDEVMDLMLEAKQLDDAKNAFSLELGWVVIR